jgi:hypothetical protein
MAHTQDNKNVGRKQVKHCQLAQAREGEEEGEGEEFEREEERNLKGKGAMDWQRPRGQKARPRCRQREKESSILRICLESIGPAEDTLSNCFINSNQDSCTN